MPYITERTSKARGTLSKAGAIRRIAVTLDERLFLDLKGSALSDGRSISDEAARCLRYALAHKPKAQAS